MAVKVFFCYAREDEKYLNDLKAHLIPLTRQGLIETLWHDRDISAGMDWAEEIIKQLDAAKFILLLISPAFMASEYCYGVEMKRAIERHDRQLAHVIPIILRPVHWQVESLQRLQALPRDGLPITGSSWHSVDEAFYDVAEGIRTSAKDFLVREYIATGDKHLNSDRNDDALNAYSDAHALDAENAQIFYKKSQALLKLQRYDDALASVEQAIQLTRGEYYSYDFLKARILVKQKKHEDAIASFDRVIQLAPRSIDAYYEKALLLVDLQRNEEAIMNLDQALKLSPQEFRLCYLMAQLLIKVKHFAQAMAIFDYIIELAPNDREAYELKVQLLMRLLHYEEAITVFDKILQLDSKNLHAYHGKCHAYRELKRYEDAIDVLDEITGLFPEDADAYAQRAELFVILQRNEEAIDDVKKYMNIKTKDVDAYFFLFDLLMRIRQYKEAIEVLDQTLLLSPDLTEIHHKKILLFIQLERYNEAITIADQAIHIDPRNANFFNLKGQLYESLAQQAYGQARQLSQPKAIELPPQGDPEREPATAVPVIKVPGMFERLFMMIKLWFLG